MTPSLNFGRLSGVPISSSEIGYDRYDDTSTIRYLVDQYIKVSVTKLYDMCLAISIESYRTNSSDGSQVICHS